MVGSRDSVDADWEALRQSPSARGPQPLSSRCRSAGMRWGRDALNDRPALSTSDIVGDSMGDLRSTHLQISSCNMVCEVDSGRRHKK